MDAVLMIEDSKLNPCDEVCNGTTRRITSHVSRKRGESFENYPQVEIPRQNDQVATTQEQQNSAEVEGLRTILDVFKKEIANMQLETQKLSSNITTAQREFSQLSTQIHKSTPDQTLKSELAATMSANEAPTAARRLSAARSRGRTESVFTNCSSTTRTSSIDSTASSPSGLRKVFGRPVVEQPPAETGSQENASIKQGWLWKTPITSSERNLKKGWTKRWFVLKGFNLSYYRLKESSLSPGKDAEGKVPKRSFDLSSGSTTIRKPNLDDLAKKMKDIKKFLPKGDVEVDVEESDILRCFIFVQVAEGKLCLQAENPEDAASWLSLFSKRLSQITYMEKTRISNAEPDQRVLKILEHPEINAWDFNDCANTQSLLVGLPSLLENCANIKLLNLARCKLRDDDIMKLQGPLAAISPRVSLQRLDLSENMIRAKGAAGLGLAICECSTLREILLDHNQLSDRGLEILARNIWGCGRPVGVALQVFSVVDNNITDKGVQVFAEILAKAPTPIGLTTLQLGQNRISDQGTAILRVCKGHPNIVVDLQSDESILETLPRYNSSKSRRALFQE